MRKLELGQSGLLVSEYCLGTMTWGSQNSEAEAHDQIDRALAAGIDFIDTAEMYPTTPLSPETVGRTEEILGAWIAKSGRRDAVTIASKITGPNAGFVRDGAGVDGDTIVAACEASLRRLATDVIDLYQLHWPNRGSYHFRRIWDYDPSSEDPADTRAHMDEVMAALTGLVAQGKIRAFGLSNDTAWGTMGWIAAAERAGGPRVASLQNEYSLLCRQFDSDLAELSVNEEVTLLAFSPLASGLLTGKYQNGRVPAGSRMSINDTLAGRVTERVRPAVAAYLDIARRHGLDPVQMALAWCRSRPMPTIPILGATSAAQLDLALGAAGLTLPEAVLDEIAAAHKAHPMPY